MAADDESDTVGDPDANDEDVGEEEEEEEEEEELSNEEKLVIIQHFLLQSPPGEYEEVLSDAAALVPEGVLSEGMSVAAPTFPMCERTETAPLSRRLAGIARAYNTKELRASASTVARRSPRGPRVADGPLYTAPSVGESPWTPRGRA